MISDETWETSPIKERTTTTVRIEESTFYKPRAASSPRRASQRIEILRMVFRMEPEKCLETENFREKYVCHKEPRYTMDMVNDKTSIVKPENSLESTKSI